jgi:2-succinyl-6-hydroxy-2,4-cyclohexadiene-1-carboxylate synthase
MADPNRLVFLHGFTQTHHHWHGCALRIAAACDHPAVRFVDLPGHGLSTDDPTGISDAADPLVDLAGPGTYIGYSMGGRYALHAALARPDAVRRLVLIGASPGIADDAERRQRRDADDRLADHVLDVGVETFIDEWLSQPLFGSFPRDQAGVEARCRNSAEGLARSLRTSGTGVQESLWDRLDELTMPVLVLAGELDAKFTDIGRRMAERIPNATFEAIPGAGHAAHGEQPGATAELVAGWLAAEAHRRGGYEPRARPTANSSP